MRAGDFSRFGRALRYITPFHPGVGVLSDQRLQLITITPCIPPLTCMVESKVGRAASKDEFEGRLTKIERIVRVGAVRPRYAGRMRVAEATCGRSSLTALDPALMDGIGANHDVLECGSHLYLPLFDPSSTRC